MMYSTFSSFDIVLTPYSNPTLITFFTMFPLVIFHHLFWINLPHRIVFPLRWILNMNLHNMNKSKGHLAKGFKSIMSPIFITILFLNFLSMAPYTWPSTSHLLVTLSWSSPLWSSMVILSLLAFWQLMAHMLPPNSPILLGPLLVMIETLSSIIQPITLAFRLAANMSAGHIILGLMGAGASFLLPRKLLFSLMLLLLAGYTMFEFVICFVQAFVFFILSTMYSNNYMHHHPLNHQINPTYASLNTMYALIKTKIAP